MPRARHGNATRGFGLLLSFWNRASVVKEYDPSISWVHVLEILGAGPETSGTEHSFLVWFDDWESSCRGADDDNDNGEVLFVVPARSDAVSVSMSSCFGGIADIVESDCRSRTWTPRLSRTESMAIEVGKKAECCNDGATMLPSLDFPPLPLTDRTSPSRVEHSRLLRAAAFVFVGGKKIQGLAVLHAGDASTEVLFAPVADKGRASPK